MRLCLSFSLLAFGVSAGLGAPFQNLDFEAYDPATGLVPGWSFENERVSTVDGSKILTHLPLDYGVNDPFVDLPSATIVTRSSNDPPGKYALLLLPLGPVYPWYVRQTAEIPSDAKSMSFDLDVAQVSLKLNATEVALEFVSRNGSPLAGKDFADVSAFAGKTVTLEVTATGITDSSLPGGYTFLDNFAFSSSPIPIIPEPSTLALSVVGAFLALSHWRLLKSSQ